MSRLGRLKHYVIYTVLYPTILASAGVLSGCRSASIEATVANRSSRTISLVQVEYPSASFGTQTLAPGQDFKYRFKVLGSGPLKIAFTDSANTEHTFIGPSLKENKEGSLTIAVTDTGVDWQPALVTR